MILIKSKLPSGKYTPEQFGLKPVPNPELEKRGGASYSDEEGRIFSFQPGVERIMTWRR